LAVALGREGRFGEAEKLFREAIQKASKEHQRDVWYDFACAAAMAGRHDEALEHLSQAIDHGYTNAEWIAKDEDLKSLQGDAGLEALVARARQAAAVKTH
jgi:Tfp pilus assembly protein PilF